MNSAERLRQAFERYDAMNAKDPRTELVDGEPRPKELVYAQRMTACLNDMEPEASEAVQLAARSQHLGRWQIPRTNYPDGRIGYKRWRSELARMHAEQSESILRELGYDEELVQRVHDLLVKKRLRSDPEVQLLEDVVCVVFLQYYLEDFAAQHEDSKVIDILRKTWAKMSERGHREALKLEVPGRAGQLLRIALDPNVEL